MKSILIYGDSNVWGDGDISGRRIPMQCQWPNILRKNLGYEYLILLLSSEATLPPEFNLLIVLP